MNELIETILRAAAAGYCDFSRGGHGKWTRKFIPFISHKHLWLFTLALQYTYTVGFSWWSIIFIGWFTFAGVAFGTGDPLGKIVDGHSNHGNDDNKLGKWEKWQYLFDTDNAFTNHGLLGAFWMLGALLLFIIASANNILLHFSIVEFDLGISMLWGWVFISNGVSFYLMGFVVRLMQHDKRWAHLEKLRTFGAMLLLQNLIKL